MPIKLFIVDDHKIFRDGIISLISFEEDMEVIGSAGSVQEFMNEILKVEPDVILMDITLKDGEGTNAVKWFKEQNKQGQTLILSMHREEKYVKKVIDSGANGYLLKDAGTEEMLNAIRTVHLGNPFYSPAIMTEIVHQLTQGKNQKKDVGGHDLTKREIEILCMIANEKTAQEIADDLFISVRTVNTHRNNIMQKLQTKNTAGMVRYALRQGLVEL